MFGVRNNNHWQSSQQNHHLTDCRYLTHCGEGGREGGREREREGEEEERESKYDINVCCTSQQIFYLVIT